MESQRERAWSFGWLACISLGVAWTIRQLLMDRQDLLRLARREQENADRLLRFIEAHHRPENGAEPGSPLSCQEDADTSKQENVDASVEASEDQSGGRPDETSLCGSHQLIGRTKPNKGRPPMGRSSKGHQLPKVVLSYQSAQVDLLKKVVASLKKAGIASIDGSHVPPGLLPLFNQTITYDSSIKRSLTIVTQFKLQWITEIVCLPSASHGHFAVNAQAKTGDDSSFQHSRKRSSSCPS